MQKDAGQEEVITPEIQDVMRNLVAAIRAVKLYPVNNPIYAQSIKKSFEVLDHFLDTTPEYHVGVQQTQFTYRTIPVAKEAQLSKTIAQDVFAKGVREIVFKDGVTEEQLVALYHALALSPEELAMKSGISSILWENGATHIQITESGLDEVILSRTDERSEDVKQAELATRTLNPATAKKEIVFGGRTLVLDDLMNDPVGFGASMLNLATQTKGEHENVEDRLYALYLEGGRKIREEDPDQNDILFEGLAKSVLSLEPPYREKIIAGKLYRELDEESVSEQKDSFEEQLPDKLHEVLTGRFSNAWSIPQVKELLKQSSTKKAISPPTPALPPTSATLETVPLPQELSDLAREMAEYTPEEMEALKNMGAAGMESDIIQAAVRTLLFLLHQIKDHHRTVSSGKKEQEQFASVVHQLEDMLSYLLKKKDYNMALMIGNAFRMPVDTVFKPRMMEAIRKSASRAIILETIADLRRYAKGAPDYVAAYSYLSIMEREATEVLLELLAEEKDRATRKMYLDFAKELGKNQIMLIGEHLADERWYYVRNIVSILGDSKADQAIAFLSKVADHDNIRIRQEVVKGLISIGGKKAASFLSKFLNDKETDIQLMSIRGLTVLKGTGIEVAGPLMDFLAYRPFKKSYQELTIEAIKALGKTGGADAREFLTRYSRIKWWRSRKLQLECRSAALLAMDEIERRRGDGGRATR
jgi:hypothetical protein